MSCGCSESLSQAIAQRLRDAGLRPGVSRREFLKGATAGLLDESLSGEGLDSFIM